MRKVFDLWRDIWFRPAPVFNLAVCRVVAVGMQLFIITIFHGKSGYLHVADLPDFLYDPLPVVQLFLFGTGYRPSFDVLNAIYWLTVVAGGFSLLGLFTNPSLLVFALGNLFLQGHAYSYGDYHHPGAIMMIALLVLALSPAGATLSIDAWRRQPDAGSASVLSRLINVEERSVFAYWPLLLIQVMFALVYLDAGMSKVEQSGLDWVNGYTLQYYMAQDGIRWGSELGLWLSQHHTLIWMASWVTMLFELSFWVVLFVPVLIWVYIPLGLMMHTGIYLTMKAPFFQFMALYAVFIPWAAGVRFWRRRGRAATSTAETDALHGMEDS